MPLDANNQAPASPWREVFERVRRAADNKRDEHGVVGSINWLRWHMERRGANPNVVRNIIYRDKGKLPDKRVLFEILDELWQRHGQPPLCAPELQALLAPGNGNEHEVLQLLGREKRRVYRAFVQGVRSGGFPKVVITGRPGSGKTLLADFIQQALEVPPVAADRIARLEFFGTDLGTALVRLGTTLGVPLALLEGKLVKVGASSAFAVQADAQADIARLILDAARRFDGRQVLLLHVSQSLGGQDALAHTALRLNTADVPRVSASEWLWMSLFEPLSRLPACAMLVSMTDLPARAAQRIGTFEGPLKLTPPTISDARRFVRARLPNASSDQHEAIVQGAGRSFEELRTLTLLAEIRDGDGPDRPRLHSVSELGHLVEHCADVRLREFLTSLAVLSLEDHPDFHADALAALREGQQGELTALESAFLDPVPRREATHRCFSRQLARVLRERLATVDAGRYRAYHARAAAHYRATAIAEPLGEAATRYLSHLLEARDWDALAAWMEEHRIQQSVVRRVWLAATSKLPDGPALQRLAYAVARHYVDRGSYQHQDARDAFAVLTAAADVDVRAWTTLQRVEGLVLRAQFEQAEALLAELPQPRAPRLRAEATLAQASLARWRGALGEAERLVDREVADHLAAALDDPDVTRAHVRARMWSGLIAKDRGDLAGALTAFAGDHRGDDLMAARMAFQRGDVLMRLGHFDRALEALDEAVELAQRSEALVAEQTRYLTRRGTARRRRGELAAADADFAAARQVLQTVALGTHEASAELTDEAEQGFWLARVDDEASLNLLARGRFEEALTAVERCIRRFRRYASIYGVDATYRVCRSILRVAVTYGCRGVGQVLRRPFAVVPALGAVNADLERARTLFQQLLARVESAAESQRLGALQRDVLLSANLFSRDGRTAYALALRALDGAAYPYQRAQAHAHATVGALRCGDATSALDHVRAAEHALAETLTDARLGPDGHPERGDLELVAWLQTMAACAALQARDAESAGTQLAASLSRSDLGPFHEMMLYQVGDCAERGALEDGLRASSLSELLGLYPDAGTYPLRFADALVLRWRQLSGPATAQTHPDRARPAPTDAGPSASASRA